MTGGRSWKPAEGPPGCETDGAFTTALEKKERLPGIEARVLGKHEDITGTARQHRGRKDLRKALTNCEKADKMKG